MNAVFYTTNSDNNEYPKTLTQVASVTGSFRGESVDIVNPVFETSSSIPKTANYMYLADFGRYYYCTIETVKTGINRVTGKCDVLQSFFDYAKNCPCIISRSSNVWNTYLQDENRKFYQKTQRQYITIGDVGTPSEIVLVTVG